MTFAKVKAFFAKLFVPFTWKTVTDTEVKLKADIARFFKEAEDKAAALTANHGVDAVHARRDADLANLKAVYERHVALVEADTTAKLAEATNVLPPLTLPPVTPAAPTA